MSNDNNQQSFFELVQAGLWEREARLASFGKIDFSVVYRLAEEQSVKGLVAAGLEHVADIKAPKEVALLFAGEAMQLEQRNTAMNCYIGVIVDKMRTADIYTLLVKGQGIAQCYERPLWRACGDVDFFLSDNNYKKAADFLIPSATSVNEEDTYSQHLSMTIDPWVVELHGTLRSGLWKRIDKALNEVQRAVFYGGKVRSWMNGHTQIFLPGADEDVVFVFSHILQHFFKEGIGLRQICDWCRLLWTYRDSIDKHLLKSRIEKIGVITEWKSFAALAVDYLGMPVEAMPFYSESRKWSCKAQKIMTFILETGNFGHNRDYSYYKKYPFIVFKAISFWRHIKDFGRYFVIFPLDAIKVTWRRMCVGLTVAIRDFIKRGSGKIPSKEEYRDEIDVKMI